MELSAQDILQILPHRYPFLLVDRVLEIEENVRAVGLKNVTMNESFFTGHFPDHPIMPGVLIIEMMAQVGGIMMLISEANKGKLAYIAGIEKARFRKPVLPGDTIIAEIVMLRYRNGIGWVKATARVNEKVVCEAELSFAVIVPETGHTIIPDTHEAAGA